MSMHPPPNAAPPPFARRLTTGLIAFGFGPLLIGYFVGLWDRPYYRCFPLALLGAALLAWRGAKPTPVEAPGARPVAAALLGLTLVFLTAGTILWSPWFGAVAAWLGAAETAPVDHPRHHRRRHNVRAPAKRLG